MSAHIVNLLIEERDRLEEAIQALQGTETLAPKKRPGRPPAKKTADVYDDPTMPDWVKPAKKKRKMSAAARKRIGEATRARWAARRAAKAEVAAPKKRTMSAEGRQRIIDATKARWAAKRAAKAQAVAPKVSKKSAILAAVTPSAEDAEFKSKMSIAMKKAWAKRKKATKE